MHVRAYDPQQDKEAIRRIWRETGWLKKDQDGTPQDLEAEAGRSMVALIEGSAECLVSSAPGTL
ncbi:MAG: hypothetical protein FJZ90_05470, partial [Chloroflexi bacterium]|nr:hypothetical protein [Chloroflexota bacterium]